MKAVLFFLLVMSLNFSFAQKRIEPCPDSLAVVVSHDGRVGEDNFVNDTAKKELRIIFEQTFNDKISILVGDSLIRESVIKTEKNLGVSLNFITIDYSHFKNLPKISIILTSKKDCISFYPVVGKRIAYIDRIEGAWFVELSNLLREYR